MLTIMLIISSSFLISPMSKLYWYQITTTLIISTGLSLKLLNQEPTIMISNLMYTDLMSSSLSTLSLWITALMFLASMKILMNNNLPKLFTNICILLLVFLLLCFNSPKLIPFYIWFEASLIPTMLLIMLWGYQPERTQASMYLMLYTVSASLPLLLTLCKIFSFNNHLNLTIPNLLIFPPQMSPMMGWLILLFAFLVKLPLFYVHLWLPKAHVEAPIAGSMILAAILLKLGGYGLMRMIYIFPHMNKLLSPPISSIALMGGVCTSLICLRQSDMKSLIAYSSVSHMGLMLAGMMSNSKLSMFGSLTMMLAHGLTSSAMFMMADITYQSTHTRTITLTKGLLMTTPILTMWWFLFSCLNMAAPPSINLMSEIMLISSAMSHSTILMIPLAMISFLTTAYSMYLYTSISHGHTHKTTNPLQPIPPMYYLSMSMHFTPSIILISTPELITNWC